MTMTYSKYFAIEKKMKAAGMHVDRAEIIADFTEGRTESLRELSSTDYRELTNYMSAILGDNKFKPNKADRMRKKVIALLCQCGYTLNDKPDMQRINEWCVNRGHGKCELNNYKEQSLPALIFQAEQMLNKTIEQL